MRLCLQSVKRSPAYWSSPHNKNPVFCQELLAGVAETMHNNGATDDQVNLTLRFTGAGREEPIQVGGV